MKKLLPIVATLGFSAMAIAGTDGKKVPMYAVDDKGTQQSLGEVIVTKSKYGLVFTPSLKGLSPGIHGFHLHQNPSCEPAKKDDKLVPALAAGGHYDPKNVKDHGTPWGAGHLGDLPPLYVNDDGTATNPVLASRLSMKDLSGRALIVHAGGDNHMDTPQALGGGGARVACGVSKK